MTTTTMTTLDISEFKFGELEAETLKLVMDDIDALCGKWEVVLERSEPHEEIMAALGVPYLKRAVMKNSRPITEITKETADGKTILKLVSHLPMGNKKIAHIQIDGTPFDVDDGDTGMWTTQAMLKGGVLYQKRVNKKTGGTMYDTRGVVTKDPIGKCADSPMMCFKWGFVDKKGKEIKCFRWMKKVG